MTIEPFQIFIVDDDEDDRFIFENALKETGIPAVVSQMANGLELLALLKAKIPNMIFLDVNMPLMDGLTALEQIRINDSYKHVPIIVFSTSDNPTTVRSAYELGARLYLKKPDLYEDYIRLIGFLLSGKDEPGADTEAFVRR
jgi:CheY-like chemotaxis protein